NSNDFPSSTSIRQHRESHMYEMEYDEGDTHAYPPPSVPIPKQRATASKTAQPPTPVARPVVKPGKHFLFYVGLGMLLMLCGWSVWTLVVTPWWQSVTGQWQYGSARVAEVDVNVGHGGVISNPVDH